MDRSDKAWSPRIIPENGSQVGDQTGKGGLRNKSAGPEHTVNLRLRQRPRVALDEKTQKLERFRLDRDRSVRPKQLPTFLVQPEIPKRPRHAPSGLGSHENVKASRGLRHVNRLSSLKQQGSAWPGDSPKGVANATRPDVRTPRLGAVPSPGTHSLVVATGPRCEDSYSVFRFALERAVNAASERLELPSVDECSPSFATLRPDNPRKTRCSRGYATPLPARITFREAVILTQAAGTRRRLAFTWVGRRDVFICGPQLWQTNRTNPPIVEALIIHEIMHTLGLGENPPSSLEINARVKKRCW